MRPSTGPATERQVEGQKDCLANFARFLVEEGFIDDAGLEWMHQEVQPRCGAQQRKRNSTRNPSRRR